jgi:hypothetical protein
LLCKGDYLFMSSLPGVSSLKLHLQTFHVENFNLSHRQKLA